MAPFDLSDPKRHNWGDPHQLASSVGIVPCSGVPFFCFVLYSCVLGVWEAGGPCPVSHFCPEGASFPLACLAGTYNNLTRQAACFPCAAGYYCPENTTSYSVNPCPAGFYCPKGEMGTGDEVVHWPGWNIFFLKAGSGPCKINLQGSIWFFCVEAPKLLHRRQGCHFKPLLWYIKQCTEVVTAAKAKLCIVKVSTEINWQQYDIELQNP